MKKGIHYWALPQALNIRQKMRFAKAAGFDGIELVIRDKGELRLNSHEQELDGIRKAADQENIEIIALSNSLNWTCSLTSDIPDVREKAMEMLRRQVQIARALNVSVVLALPGFVSLSFMSDDLHPVAPTQEGANYHPGQEVIPYDTAYERALAAFREIAPFAREMGVTVCIENIWNQFLLSPIEMRNFIDEIGSDFVQVYFDVGNVMPLGHPAQWIRILGSRIRRIHLKDFMRGSGSLSGFVNLLCGNIDFREVMQALRETGYDGWLTVECNEKPGFPEFVPRINALALDQIINMQPKEDTTNAI
jgi:L-ribulose-5-phosphate 3-epimerase